MSGRHTAPVTEASGEEIVTARARAHSAMLHLWGNQPGDPAAVEREARAQLPLFERADDAGGAACTWAAIGGTFWGRCQALQAGTAWRRAVDLFNAAGNRWLAGVYLGWLSSVPVWGPAPCELALRDLEELAEEAQGSPSGSRWLRRSVPS